MTDAPSPRCSTGIVEAMPCPFCGALPYVAVKDRAAISCRNEECFGPRTTAEFLDDAIFQWNKRAPRSADAAQEAGNSGKPVAWDVQWRNKRTDPAWSPGGGRCVHWGDDAKSNHEKHVAKLRDLGFVETVTVTPLYAQPQAAAGMPWEHAETASVDANAFYLVKDNGGEWRDFDLHVMRGTMVNHKLAPNYIRGRPEWIAKIGRPPEVSSTQSQNEAD